MKPQFYVPLAVVGVFAAFFLFERIFPLRRPRAALFARVVINLAISGLAFLTALLLVKPSASHALDWTSQNSFGLVQLIPGPAWMQAIAGFLLLDLTFYYWHVLNHKIAALWRFHNVHHMDPDLDVSTGFRFHFGEVLLSTLFRVVQVSLIGMSFATFALYEIVFQAGTLFHHSNLRLPIRFERLLNSILVTPRMHGIHHSQVRRETDSNYGVVFCWWDRLHRTIGLNVPQAQIDIGVAGYSLPQDNSFWQALAFPFQKQRDYWRKPDGTVPERSASALNSNRNSLVE